MGQSEALLIKNKGIGRKESFIEEDVEEKERVIILDRRKVRWIKAVRGE